MTSKKRINISKYLHNTAIVYSHLLGVNSAEDWVLFWGLSRSFNDFMLWINHYIRIRCIFNFFKSGFLKQNV